MNYTALILEALPIVASIFLSTGKFIKGNKKYLVAIAAYFVLKWIADKAALERAKDNLQVPIDPTTGNPTVPQYTSPELLAKEYRLAFDPWNTGFVGWNGTDTEGLYTLAGKTFNWAAVRQSYKTLYKTDLVEDLESELSASELKNFYSILNRS